MLFRFDGAGKMDDLEWTRATFYRVDAYEKDDSEQEVFKRRMGMRNYFK